MAKSANDILREETIAHQVGLQGYSVATVRKIIALVNRAELDVVEQIRGTNDLTSITRLNKLLTALREINAEAYDTITSTLQSDLEDLAKYELKFQTTMIESVVPIELDLSTPSPSKLAAAVNSRPFQGRLLKEWYSQLTDAAQVRLRGAVRMGFTEGESIDQIVARVRGTRPLQYRNGVSEISRRGAEALVRTAVSHTANAARNLLYEENAEVIKAVQWVSTLDSRTTLICMSRDGMTFPPNKGPRPPAHINCLPGDSLVLSRHRITGASKRWYEGKMFVIRTSTGRELTCTPNHPVLTKRGWVAAQFLNLEDNVVCEGFIDTPASAWFESDNKNMPARIEEIASSFFHHAGVTVAKVPVSSIDFHGDGIDGQIAIVGSDRKLRNRSITSSLKKLLKFSFKLRNKSVVLLSTLRSMVPLFERPNALVSNSLVGGSSQGLSGLGSSVLQSESESITEISKLESGLLHSSLNSPGRDTVLARDIIEGKTGPIFFDKLVDIRDFDSSGHVYNLETVKGFYVSGGIITHNCRSTTTPVLKSWKELGINLAEAPAGTRASMDGQVSATTTYNDWLKTRTSSFQDEVLGKARADLFRKGNLSLDRFVDRNGVGYTLDELRQREAAAFAAAGL